jgi:hypothetical protein
VATITEDQRKILGDRSLSAAIRESNDFSVSAEILFSSQVRDAHHGQWVAVYHRRVIASPDFDGLLGRLGKEGIPSESSAVGFIE